MKLSSAVLMLSTMAVSATANMKVSGKNVAKVLRAARRVEENGDDAAEEDEYSYLTQYTLKMIGCKSGETVVDAETGEYEYNAAVFRLCPTETCDDENERGCGAGYGDFVVGLNTYVDAFFEDQRDNMNWDDQFQVDKYAECSEYEVENDGDDANNPYANYQFFIGPTCAEDGLDVKLAVFSDDTCTTESEVAFEDLSNGWALPYSTGGIVSTECTDCLAYNDNGEYELREMCQELYESAASKCETEMEYYSYYGQNVQGCEYITEVMPALTGGGGAGKVFGWLVFICLVGGLAGYIVWWRKSESYDDDDDYVLRDDGEPQQTRRRFWWQRAWARLFSWRRRR
jgi:hypothetical protein